MNEKIVKHSADHGKGGHGKQWLWILLSGLVLIGIATFAVKSHGWFARHIAWHRRLDGGVCFV